MKSKPVLLNILIISLCITLLGGLLFGLAILLGAELFDGFAGDRRTNTSSQNALLIWGNILAVAGVIVFGISALALIIRSVYRRLL